MVSANDFAMPKDGWVWLKYLSRLLPIIFRIKKEALAAEKIGFSGWARVFKNLLQDMKASPSKAPVFFKNSSRSSEAVPSEGKM
jgi:hypothetical protein